MSNWTLDLSSGLSIAGDLLTGLNPVFGLLIGIGIVGLVIAVFRGLSKLKA